MRINAGILAGTALAVLMTSTTGWAGARMGAEPNGAPSPGMAPTLAQAEPGDAPLLPVPPVEEPETPAPLEAPAPKAPPAPEPPPAPEAPPAAQPAEPEPAPQPAPAPEAPPVAPPAEEILPPAPPEIVPPAPEAPPEQPPEQPQPEPAPQPAPPPEVPPAIEQPAEQVLPEPAPQPAEQAPAAPPAAEQPPVEPAPQEAQPPAQAPVPEAPPAGEQPAAQPPSEPAPQEAQPPAQGEPAPAVVPEAPPANQTQAPNDGSAAPLLDSQKQQPAPAAPADGSAAQQPPAAPPAPAGPPPASDAAAQQNFTPAEIAPVTQEKGVRVERSRERPDRRERPEGVDVLREIGDRVILEFGGQARVESDDRPRMSRGAREVYYEDLPRGRTRETIVRGDGTQVVTVRNSYGDVVRRSRIAPDGREHVLVYVNDADYERLRDWRDPGLDLPPMHLDIPREEYILDSTRSNDPDVYYDFLEQPPVEAVERLYSVDEVKRSARIRDKTRRVDLDTLTFEFGSASVPEDQIVKLESVAQAMERLLEQNPVETFLIEGHTDAVGSDVANLALSDRRAESVADALSNVFGIPPENLATQGYGEQYLKVRSEAPERENRRVAIRRITSLVAPVASAQ